MDMDTETNMAQTWKWTLPWTRTSTWAWHGHRHGQAWTSTWAWHEHRHGHGTDMDTEGQGHEHIWKKNCISVIGLLWYSITPTSEWTLKVNIIFNLISEQDIFSKKNSLRLGIKLKRPIPYVGYADIIVIVGAYYCSSDSRELRYIKYKKCTK